MHALGDAIEPAFDAPDGVMRIAIAIERDHDRVDGGRDVGGMRLDQQPGRDQRDADAKRLELPAQRPEIAMQQRLAAGQHHALHAQRADRVDVPLEIVGRDLALVGVGLPDVAHHASAVAGAVHAQREDRQALEPMRDAAPGAAGDLSGPTISALP